MLSKDFLFGGHAIFTVSNPADEYYTYRVSAPKDQHEDNPIWFVSVLTGPDNTSDYTYLGLLRKGGELFVTKKSRYKNDDKIVNVVRWAVSRILLGGEIKEGYKIQHIGKCGRCGRPLTTPESVESGIGPICAGRASRASSHDAQDGWEGENLLQNTTLEGTLKKFDDAHQRRNA